MSTVICGNPRWYMEHTELSVEPSGEVNSKSCIVLEFLDCKVKIARTSSAENHVLGSKKVLMDSAYLLENIVKDMKKKAENMK